jgi:hypothetical protein
MPASGSKGSHKEGAWEHWSGTPAAIQGVVPDISFGTFVHRPAAGAGLLQHRQPRAGTEYGTYWAFRPVLKDRSTPKSFCGLRNDTGLEK